MKNFKVTSATLVTILGLIGSVATALTHSGDVRLVAVGLGLAGVYTVCHTIAAVYAPQVAETLPTAPVATPTETAVVAAVASALPPPVTPATTPATK